MNWSKPQYEERRFGFEVTMYIYQKSTPSTILSEPEGPRESKPKTIRSLSKILSSVVLCTLLASPSSYAFSFDLEFWLNLLQFGRGIDIQNTRSFNSGPINASTVGDLEVKWVYQTTPDSPTGDTTLGSISSTPAVKGKYLYFNDMSGNITKLNRFTGALVWKKSYVNDLSVPGYTITQSRNTPYIRDSLVVVGSNYGMITPLCKVTGANPSANVCTSGDGAIILALDKMTGKVVWRAKADNHPAGKITGSISGHGNVIYVPVGNWEEDWARAYPNIYKSGSNGKIDPNSRYPCCSSRGSLVAMDVNTGKILWKTYIVPGDGTVIDPQDNNPPLSQSMKALLTPKGFFGSSTYGHNPTIDLDRKQIYIATAQTTTAPKVAEDCEKYRRGTLSNPPALPSGVTCNNLNSKLNNYASAVLALDMNTGKVKWVNHSRQYDAWNHACAAPDFYGWGVAVPIVWAVPFVNNANCFQNPIGPDNGFGQQPMLLDNVLLKSGVKTDLVVVGNKDGRLFGLDPDTGKQIWVTNTDPGGIYGGLQFGRATDGKRIFFGTTNSSNVNRDKSVPFRSATQFLKDYGFDKLNPPVRVGLYSQGDAGPLIDFPAPSSQVMPFIGPDLFYGINDYKTNNPLYPADGVLKISSGPRELWKLINPPSDVIPDGKTVFASSGGALTTVNGMVQAVEASSGKILWQRPAFDGIRGALGPGQAFGTLTVGNGVVFIGYADGRGTMVALDATTGRKLFQFQAKVPVNNVLTPRGFIESGPQVVGRRVYWGVGAETAAYFPARTGVASVEFLSGGNRLYMFMLPYFPDDELDDLDMNTTLDD